MRSPTILAGALALALLSRAAAQAPPEASAIAVPEGFVVERLWVAPPEQGAWVALAFLADGTAVAGDEDGSLHRVVLGATPRVTRLALPIGDVKGLCAGPAGSGAVYAVVSGSTRFANGLYRLTDSDWDGEPDRVECLRAFESTGARGLRSVVLGPDASLYVLGIDGVAAPTEALAEWGPAWLPVGRLPVAVQTLEGSEGLGSGWIARTDPEGKRWEVVAVGLGPESSFAFLDPGLALVLEAGSEAERGLPWFAPPALFRLRDRADYGYRPGSARWPRDFPDVDAEASAIGLTAPAELRSGAGLGFPEPYARALLAADARGGRILAQHGLRDGAPPRVEVFASGRPFPVRALGSGRSDGLCLVTAGPGSASVLWRIRWRGPAAAEPEGAPPAVHELERAPRELSWARTAPPERAREQLARLVEAPLFPEPDRDRPGAALEVARTLELALLRSAPLEPATRARLAEALLAVFPSGDAALDRELGVLLASLPEAAERFVPLAVERCVRAVDGAEAFHWAFLLRGADAGWTLAARRKLLNWLYGAQLTLDGGRAVPLWLATLREDLLAGLPAEARQELGALVEPPPELLDGYASARPFVRAWTLAALEPRLGELGAGRDAARGRRILEEACCIACHRVEGRGGGGDWRRSGPALTGLAGRYSAAELLAKLLSPSRAVPDGERDTIVTLADGRRRIGRVLGGGEEDELVLRERYGLGERLRIEREEIASVELSPLSPMPSGLLDTLSAEEILDLLAWLLAAE